MGRTSGRRATKEVGRGGAGGDDSEGLSRGEREQRQNIGRRVGGGRGGTRPTDGVVMGRTGYGWVRGPAGSAAGKSPPGRLTGGRHGATIGRKNTMEG